MSDEYRISKNNFTIAEYDAVVPKDVVVLTAGICTYYFHSRPIQHITVVGWNKLGGARVISNAGFVGPLNDTETLARIKKYLDDGFDSANGRNFPVRALAVDVTGHDDTAYDFVDEIARWGKASLRGPYAWAVKSANVERGNRRNSIWPLKSSIKEVDFDGGRKPRKYFSVDTQLAKDAILRLLRGNVERGPYSGFLIPDDIDTEMYNYLDRLVCEERVSTNLGAEWRPTHGKETTPEWKSLVLAYVALRGLKTMVRDYSDLNVVANRLGITELFLNKEEEQNDQQPSASMSLEEAQRRTTYAKAMISLLNLAEVGRAEVGGILESAPTSSPKSAPESDTLEGLTLRKLRAETEMAELQLEVFKYEHEHVFYDG